MHLGPGEGFYTFRTHPQAFPSDRLTGKYMMKTRSLAEKQDGGGGYKMSVNHGLAPTPAARKLSTALSSTRGCGQLATLQCWAFCPEKARK